MRWTSWIEGRGGAAIALPLRMTLLALVLRPAGFPPLRVASLALAGLGLMSPRLLEAPVVWLALAGLVGARVVADWPLADNHIYLAGYWCLAIGLAARASRGSDALAASGRVLVGLTFAFAVLWKTVLSPDYVDGRFYRVTLLTDERFASVTRLLGGLSAEELQAGRHALRPLPAGVTPLDEPGLPETPGFARLATVATWGTVALEAAVAVAFLAPLSAARCSIRHAVLLTFCTVTYAFAPVAGFGWLLVAMGLAQCRPEDRVWRGLYLATAGFVLFHSELSWAGIVLDALS